MGIGAKSLMKWDSWNSSFRRVLLVQSLPESSRALLCPFRVSGFGLHSAFGFRT
jgi:hypothetical protein